MSINNKTQAFLYQLRSLKPWAFLALLVILLQVFLGSWTSSNYAALVCPHFPFCKGTLWPHMDWHQAFNLAAPLRLNYNALITIQMAHRYGALLTTAVLLPLSICMIARKKFTALHLLGWIILLLLIAQITLGILNIIWRLPISTAIGHIGIAVLLLLSVITLIHKIHINGREKLL